MMTTRLSLTLMAAALVTTAAPASACSIGSKAVDRFPKAAAAEGYLVRARIVRGYDTVRRLPEQLEIEKVFVGGDLPRLVSLDRDKEFFDQHPPPAPGVTTIYASDCSAEYAEAPPEATLMILYPARSEAGAVILGVFRLRYFDSFPRAGRKLDIMLDQAKRHGRLRERPSATDFSAPN